MGVDFSLAGGAKGALSCRTVKVKFVLLFFCIVDRNFVVALQPFE